MNVLFFVQPGTNSRSTLLDLMKGFQRSGHPVIHFDLEPFWAATARAGADQTLKMRLTSELTAVVRSMLVHNRIDLSVAMWANALGTLSAAGIPDPAGGTNRVASIFDLIPQKHLCYWLDAPHWAHEGSAVGMIGSQAGQMVRSENVHHAINNEATAMEMREVFGMKNVIAQHYGIDEEVFRPRDVEKEFEIVFGLGPGDGPPTKLMEAELGRDEPDVNAIRHEAAERLRGKVVAMADRVRGEGTSAEASRALLDELLRTQVADRHAPMYGRLRALAKRDEAWRGAVAAICTDLKLFVELTSLVRQVETWERAFTFAYLSRRFNCATFGAGGQALAAWGAKATHLGHIAWHEQAVAYSRGRIGLNVMRWQDDAGLNVKPYEITASGAACLCARRAGIENLFDTSREIAVFDDPGEAARRAGKLLVDKAKLGALAEAGRARTLREYTWTAVARDLVQAIGG